MQKRDAINVITQEIEWCKNNQGHYTKELDPEFKKGFIKGLKAAIRLIKAFDFPSR
jgi:hypothetical protein